MLTQDEIREIRKDFPYLKKDPSYIYIDNAATSQKPIQVLNALKAYYESENGNPHRSAHIFAQNATLAYENARERTSKFINAERPEEIVFVRNASEAFNLVAYTLGMELKKDDEIILTVMEHHSNMVPWQFVAQKTGAKIKYLFPDSDMQFSEEDFRKNLSDKTKIISMTAASNVVGTMPDVKKFISIARELTTAKIMLDTTQYTPHHKTDVKDLDCDFLAFSGHKMLSAMGVGVLYGKYDILKEMPPFLFGGEMIDKVTLENTTFADPPGKFEAGTVNVGGAVSLKVAMDYLENVGLDKIYEYESRLMDLAYEGMKNIKGIEIYSTPIHPRTPALAFNFKEVHPHDVATILDSEKVAIRSGHHCCEPLHKFLGIPASSRASFAFYNTEEEVERFLDKLNVVKKVMKIGDE